MTHSGLYLWPLPVEASRMSSQRCSLPSGPTPTLPYPCLTLGHFVHSTFSPIVYFAFPLAEGPMNAGSPSCLPWHFQCKTRVIRAGHEGWGLGTSALRFSHSDLTPQLTQCTSESIPPAFHSGLFWALPEGVRTRSMRIPLVFLDILPNIQHGPVP